MKIIFLDYDGVITNRATDYESFDADCLEYLNQIIEKTDAKVVVISSKRMFYKDHYEAFEELKKSGFKGQVIDFTEDLRGFRSNEIKLYLEKHPEIKSYLILDDMPDFYNEMFPGHFIVPNSNLGLEKHHIDESIKILNMNTQTKLFLDDDPARDWMAIGWHIVRSYDEFVSWILKNGLPDEISFDHDLADQHYEEGAKTNFQLFNYNNVTEKTGKHCAEWLVQYCLDENKELPKWSIHSYNSAGRINIKSVLDSYEFLKNQKDEKETKKD